MIKEILRLKSAGLGAEKVAAALGISKNTVKSYVRKHQLAASDAVPGPLVTALDGMRPLPSYSAPWSPLVDWPKVKDETDQGAQLRQLWEDWIQVSDDVEWHVDLNPPWVLFSRFSGPRSRIYALS